MSDKNRDLSVPNLNVGSDRKAGEQAETRLQFSSSSVVPDDGESSMEQFVDEILDDDPFLSTEAPISLGGEGISLPTPVSSDLIDLSDASLTSKGSFTGLIPPEDPLLTPNRVPRVSKRAVSDSVRRVLDSSNREKDADEMQLTPLVLGRPRALTQENRCLTPQYWQTAHVANKNFLAPPASPMSRLSVRTARSETFYHTYETDPHSKPSPVPPFVVVHSNGHALIKVKPRSNDLPEDFVDEDQGSTTSSTLSFRSCCRLSTMLILAGIVVLCAVTVAAGLLKGRHDQGAPIQTDGEPSMAPQDIPTNASFPVSGPSSSEGIDDTLSPEIDGVMKLPYQETGTPSIEETRPPRTFSPSMAEEDTFEPTVAPVTEAPSVAPSMEEEIPWNNYVIGLLSVESPDTFSDLDDNQSSQYKALKWLSLEMANEDTIVYNQDSSLQKFGLLCFWFATGGSDWNDTSGWLTPGTSECTWAGVTCDTTNTVIALNQEGNNLSGTLPPEIRLVKNLQALLLSGNSIAGNLPISITEMSELIDLNLSANQLEGPLPSEFGSLDLLQTFDASRNLLTGTIPSSIGAMSNLEVLNLCSNDFEGTLPSQIGSLAYLRTLNLGRNPALFGDMPDAVCDLGSSVARSAVPIMVVDCSVDCECCLECCDSSVYESVEGECCSI